MEGKYFDLSQDATLGGDSPSTTKIPSQAALKAYIDAKAAAVSVNYFYVEDASGSANTLTIKKNNNALPDKVFEWSLDKQNWTEITVTDTTGVSIAVPANGRVYLRGDNDSLNDSNGAYKTSLDCAYLFNVGGDLSTLIAKSGNQKTCANYCFRGFFQYSTVKDASQLILPALILSGGCYQNLFNGCASLTAAPQLPALKLASYCYGYMFEDCTALTSAPILPALLVSSNGYNGMFHNCALIDRIEIYATTWNNQNNWLNNVAATGDFYNLGGATIPTGTNGIPSGWTEHTQLP